MAGCLSAGVAPAQIVIVDNLGGAFIDISTTGTPVPFVADPSGEPLEEQEGVITTSIGNNLFPPGKLMVGWNGGIAWEPFESEDLSELNGPLPALGPYPPDPDCFGGSLTVLPYWDDLGNGVGNVYYEEFSDKLIVQWEGVPLDSDPERPLLTFQVQIFNDAQDGPREAGQCYAQFVYRSVKVRGGAGASATIGVQLPADEIDAKPRAVTWSVNKPGAIRDGTVLSVCWQPLPQLAPPPVLPAAPAVGFSLAGLVLIGVTFSTAAGLVAWRFSRAAGDWT
jgi:hypothetical protein